MGRPLYFYSGDTNPGDVNGEGINKVWYVANVAGTVPTTPPTPTPQLSGHQVSPEGVEGAGATRLFPTFFLN